MPGIDASYFFEFAEKKDRKRFWRELFIHRRDTWAELRMDNVLRTTAALPPRGSENVPRAGSISPPVRRESPRLPYTFVVGSFGTNITIHDQQWRGLELAEAIIRIRGWQGEVDSMDEPRNRGRVCIVGGGFAGTAAAMWLLKNNVDFRLVEKSKDVLMGQFYDSDCWVHPSIWDWPLYDLSNEADGAGGGKFERKTYFPDSVDSLNWEAGKIKDVAKAVRDNITAEKGFMDKLVKDESIEASDIQPHDDGVWVRIRGTWEYFKVLLLCVGFGAPRQLRGAVKSTPTAEESSNDLDFWSRCGNHRYPNNTQHLIYGGGDTALMEAIQRSTAGHQQPYELLASAQKFGLSERFKELGENFRKADQEYEVWRGLADDPERPLWQIRRNLDSPYFHAVVDFFAKLYESDGFWDKWEQWMAQTMDWNQRVVLAMRHEIIRARSARLNRVLCVLLHAASRFYWMKQNLKAEEYRSIFEPQGTGTDSKKRTFRDNLFELPLLTRDENTELGDPEKADERGYNVDEGLMIVGNVRWIGKTTVKLGEKLKPHHLARVTLRGSSVIAAGEYDEFVPCIGQDEPNLLRELSDSVDVNSLRIRQKDWKWY